MIGVKGTKEDLELLNQQATDYLGDSIGNAVYSYIIERNEEYYLIVRYDGYVKDMGVFFSDKNVIEIPEL